MYWNEDVTQSEIGGEILNVVNEWPSLSELQLVGPIHSKNKRDQWRETFKLKKIKVLLSKRELDNAVQTTNLGDAVDDFNTESSMSEEEEEDLDEQEGSEDSLE